MDVVVDDHLLLRVLLKDEPLQLRAPGARLFTTGLWYHRLCRAVATPTVVGALSGSLGHVDVATARAAVQAIVSLPEPIGVLSLRELGWSMARLLGDGVRLNLMSLEALSAAERLGAELCLAADDENPQLIAAARRRNTQVRILDS